MGITEKETSMLALLCAGAAGAKTAHPTKVGLLPVLGGHVSTGIDLAGGAPFARPRTTEPTIFVQRTLGAYGRPQGVNGTSVLTAQGSQMAKPLAPAGAQASGVPPRGRPV
jgi:hypothetical protein